MTQRREEELIAKVGELAEIGLRMQREIEEAFPQALREGGQSKGWEYFQEGVRYLRAAWEEFLREAPAAAIGTWAKEFERELRSEVGPGEADKATSLIALSPATWRKVLTPGRSRLLAVLAEEPVRSISELAERVNRPLESVSRDLRILRNYGFIEFEREGKRKRPILLKHLVFVELRAK